MTRTLQILTVILAAFVCAACSTVSVTRTAGGAIHAGVSSFAGKQSIADTTITTREGDTIRLNGYSTQNPDPETTKIIRDGWIGGKAISAGADVLETGIEEGASLINQAID